MSLECCMCGEPFGTGQGHDIVHDYGDGLRVCEYCNSVAVELISALLPNSLFSAQLSVVHRRERAIKALIQLLLRTGHKANVRVRQHEKKHPVKTDEP